MTTRWSIRSRSPWTPTTTWRSSVSDQLSPETIEGLRASTRKIPGTPMAQPMGRLHLLSAITIRSILSILIVQFICIIHMRSWLNTTLLALSPW